VYDGYNRDVIDIIFLFLLMPVYSFSQINIFQQCPLKYRYQYIDKIKVAQQPQSPHMLLGSAVHWALERLYRQLNQMQIPTREQVIQYVHEYWKKEIDYTQIEFPEDIPESVFLRR
jgi:ATP-dependent helicase/DNAse subunit B